MDNIVQCRDFVILKKWNDMSQLLRFPSFSFWIFTGLDTRLLKSWTGNLLFLNAFFSHIYCKILEKASCWEASLYGEQAFFANGKFRAAFSLFESRDNIKDFQKKNAQKRLRCFRRRHGSAFYIYILI